MNVNTHPHTTRTTLSHLNTPGGIRGIVSVLVAHYLLCLTLSHPLFQCEDLSLFGIENVGFMNKDCMENRKYATLS